MTLLLMIFLHIVDDYRCQGILAQMKQKKYWEDNAPDELYKYDYIWALIMHSFSWTFMIMLPLCFVAWATPMFYIVFFANVAIHAYVDDLKANRHKINLWEDQLAHLGQILITYCLLGVF